MRAATVTRTLAVAAALVAGIVTVTAQKPDESRFTSRVLIGPGELDEPMVLQVLPDERVLIIERKGALKVYDPATNATSLVAKIPVNTKYYSAAGVVSEAEEGLIALAIDPKFTENRWIYMKYADPQVAKWVLARWELREAAAPGAPRALTLVESSKRVLMEHPAQRERCCHTGGGTAWDRQGNLYITVGNNTGGGMFDERPGMQNSDDQRTSGNANDLRGKILRIHPEPDGTYTIPPGNLFPPGTAGTRPEIFGMGMRNPWRVSVDSRTGFVYWGEVGPSDQRATGGPTPVDELNQARGAGNFGFPYFVGENEGVRVRDFLNSRVLPPRDPQRPFNESVNNTGIRDLPPAQPAFIAYSYEVSDKYPELGSGAKSAVGGPIYRRADFKADAKRPFPAYYEGKWIAADFDRGWIMAIAMRENGDYASMEPFFPTYRALQPIDLQFGPEGDLYVLDYGSVWFAKSPDSSLVKIEYTAGNRKPKAQLAASTRGGPVPLALELSSTGSADPDGDRLRYAWRVSAPGRNAQTSTVERARMSLSQPGVYTASLTVTDPSGATDTASVEIVAGNTPPAVTLEAAGFNQTFFQPGAPVKYTVKVSDKEDTTIAGDRVVVSIDHVSDTFDERALVADRNPVDATTKFSAAKALIATTDCAACHQRDIRAVGPSFVMLAERYRPDPQTLSTLANKVRLGGSKVWGDVEMPPHPTLPLNDIKTIVRYMLSVNDTSVRAFPLESSITLVPEGDTSRGRVVLRATYTDNAVGALPAQTSTAVKVLRSMQIVPASADVVQGVTFGSRSSGGGAETRHTAVTALRNGHIGFRQIDLTGVQSLVVSATTSGDMKAAGGTIDVRIDGPAGPAIGQVEIGVPPPAPRGRGAGAAGAAPGPGRGGGGTVIPLRATAGVHDLYLVFRNDQAVAGQPLMTVSQIRVN
jgi:cytochrome c